MWRFLGVAPPKKRKTEEETTQANRDYDRNKRKRTFQDSWLKKYEWLDFDKESNKMFCKHCRSLDTVGTFVTGCSNFKIESVETHSQSAGHRKNVSIVKAKTQNVVNSPAMGCLRMMNAAASEKLKVLFRNAHYVAKTNRPYTDFVSMCKLDKAKGIDLGQTYLNDKYCQKFVTAIAQTISRQQDDFVEKSDFISVISDGSTDVSSTEAEIVYLRTSHQCQVKTFFIGIKNVPKADSENISGAIANLLADRYSESWKSKLVATGTDGAAVMIGEKNGVVQKLRDLTGHQYIRAIHCSAHRLELAYKDAVKSIPIHMKCEALLLNLYLFYKYSPLNRSNLRKSFHTLNQSVLVPTRVGGTRWLPHTNRAITNVLTGKEAIMNQLEEMQSPAFRAKQSSAKARNFLKALKDDQVIFWLHLMWDITKCLGGVSQQIQNSESSVAEVWLQLESAKYQLNRYMKSDGTQLRKFKRLEELSKTMEKRRTLVFQNLIESINHRFDGDMHLFGKCSSLLTLREWPEKLDGEFCDDTVLEIVELCEEPLKVAGVKTEEIEREFVTLKTTLSCSKTDFQQSSWNDLCRRYGDTCKNFFKLIDFLLCLPSGSVDAERGFSRMKIV